MMGACSVHDRDGDQGPDGDLGRHAKEGLGRGLEAARDEPEHTDRPGEPEPDRRFNGQSGFPVDDIQTQRDLRAILFSRVTSNR